MNETENQTRLRRSKEALAVARDTEIAAIKALHDATEVKKRAMARYEECFLREQAEEVARLKSEYRHATK